MQQNDPDTSVLEYLSFEADQRPQETRIPMTPDRLERLSSSSRPNEGSRSKHIQGILWKRRDVFKNTWRPRWFVLHPNQRVLTYYILANQETENIVSAGAFSTPSRRRPASAFTTPASPSVGIDNAASDRENENQGTTRRRALSESSDASARTIDCDVVPRGTIYLQGSTVEANEALTRPDEDLYALTITDHENATHCHLAARTIESRDQWISRIRRVCQRGNGAQHQEQQKANTQTPYSQRTPMIDSKHSAEPLANSRPDSDVSTSNQNGQLEIQQIDRSNDTNNAAEKGFFNYEHSLQEKEILILFAPLVLYKVLKAASLFNLAAFCFTIASIMVMRWVLIEHLLQVARAISDKDRNENSMTIMPIGHGSICCRFKENLIDVCPVANEVTLSHILVWSLAKVIQQQPHLASNKYKLLPRFYSTDIVYLDADDNASNEVWVNKADEKTLSDIVNYFNATPQDVTFLQQAIGPACRIVTSSSSAKKDKNRDFQDCEIDLNISDCPITVFVFRSTRVASTKTQEDNISINFRSTNVEMCRKFVETFRQSIRSVRTLDIQN